MAEEVFVGLRLNMVLGIVSRLNPAIRLNPLAGFNLLTKPITTVMVP